MDTQDIAYLAGIIDGEGCVSVAINKKNGRNYYRLTLDITNTNDNLMQWIQGIFGGIVRTSYARSENRTNLHSWTASGNQAQVLIKLVLPYLKVKLEQAKLALEMNISPYGGACRWSYSGDEEEHRDAIYLDMKALNSKNGHKGQYRRDL